MPDTPIVDKNDGTTNVNFVTDTKEWMELYKKQNRTPQEEQRMKELGEKLGESDVGVLPNNPVDSVTDVIKKGLEYVVSNFLVFWGSLFVFLLGVWILTKDTRVGKVASTAATAVVTKKVSKIK